MKLVVISNRDRPKTNLFWSLLESKKVNDFQKAPNVYWVRELREACT